MTNFLTYDYYALTINSNEGKIDIYQKLFRNFMLDLLYDQKYITYENRSDTLPNPFKNEYKLYKYSDNSNLTKYLFNNSTGFTEDSQGTYILENTIESYFDYYLEQYNIQPLLEQLHSSNDIEINNSIKESIQQIIYEAKLVYQNSNSVLNAQLGNLSNGVYRICVNNYAVILQLDDNYNILSYVNSEGGYYNLLNNISIPSFPILIIRSETPFEDLVYYSTVPNYENNKLQIRCGFPENFKQLVRGLEDGIGQTIYTIEILRGNTIFFSRTLTDSTLQNSIITDDIIDFDFDSQYLQNTFIQLRIERSNDVAWNISKIQALFPNPFAALENIPNICVIQKTAEVDSQIVTIEFNFTKEFVSELNDQKLVSGNVTFDISIKSSNGQIIHSKIFNGDHFYEQGKLNFQIEFLNNIISTPLSYYLHLSISKTNSPYTFSRVFELFSAGPSSQSFSNLISKTVNNIFDVNVYTSSRECILNVNTNELLRTFLNLDPLYNEKKVELILYDSKQNVLASSNNSSNIEFRYNIPRKRYVEPDLFDEQVDSENKCKVELKISYGDSLSYSKLYDYDINFYGPSLSYDPNIEKKIITMYDGLNEVTGNPKTGNFAYHHNPPRYYPGKSFGEYTIITDTSFMGAILGGIGDPAFEEIPTTLNTYRILLFDKSKNNFNEFRAFDTFDYSLTGKFAIDFYPFKQWFYKFDVLPDGVYKFTSNISYYVRVRMRLIKTYDAGNLTNPFFVCRQPTIDCKYEVKQNQSKFSVRLSDYFKNLIENVFNTADYLFRFEILNGNTVLKVHEFNGSMLNDILEWTGTYNGQTQENIESSFKGKVTFMFSNQTLSYEEKFNNTVFSPPPVVPPVVPPRSSSNNKQFRIYSSIFSNRNGIFPSKRLPLINKFNRNFE